MTDAVNEGIARAKQELRAAALLAARLLRSLFERRSQADYALDPVPAEEPQKAVDDASIVVDAVERWLAAGQ